MSGWGQPAGDDPFEKVSFGTGGRPKLQSARRGKFGDAGQGPRNQGAFPARAASHGAVFRDGPVNPARFGTRDQAGKLAPADAAAPQNANPSAALPPGVIQDGPMPVANGAAPQGANPGGVLPPGVIQDGPTPVANGAAPQNTNPGGVLPPGVVQDGPTPVANGAAPQNTNPSGVLPPGVVQDGPAPPANGAAPQGANPGGVLPPGTAPTGVIQGGQLPAGADLKPVDLDSLDTSNIPVVDITMVPDQAPKPQPGTQDKLQPYPGPFGMNLPEPPNWRTPQSRMTLSEALRGRGLDERVPAGWYDDPAFGYTHAPGKIEPLSYETVLNGWNANAPATSAKKPKAWKPEQGPAGWSKVEVKGKKGQFRKKDDDEDDNWL